MFLLLLKKIILKNIFFVQMQGKNSEGKKPIYLRWCNILTFCKTRTVEPTYSERNASRRKICYILLTCFYKLFLNSKEFR